MKNALFVTGTGTDVGKTYVTALLIKKLKEMGLDTSYYKAALSGALQMDSVLIPGDADYVKHIAHLEDDLSCMVSYVYQEAVSPHLAAQSEGNPVELNKIISDFQKQCSLHDYVIVEGSGGIICPIRYDESQQIFLVDIIKSLNLETIIVADAGLGTINSVCLTVYYLKQQHIGIKGIIFNNYTGSIMQQDNKKMIELMTGIPIIGFVYPNGTELIITDTILKTLYI